MRRRRPAYRPEDGNIDPGPGSVAGRFALSRRQLLINGGIALAVILFGGFIFVWFGMRIDVPPEHYVVLVKKTGENITNDRILAPDEEHKGIQKIILKEGRYFKNPYTWDWTEPERAVVIPKGRVGIKVRLYGEELPEDQIMAVRSEQKGIVPDVLKPGRYPEFSNQYEYRVEIADMQRIEPGHVGIITRLVGTPPAEPNVFVVTEGEIGTQPNYLRPGTYPEYSNPYVFRVTPVEVRSQKFEMKGPSAISFPSRDGFPIIVEGTIEWAPITAKLPELFVRFIDTSDRTGGIAAFERKIILPYARSFFRVTGGAYSATDYITGDTRIKVQNAVADELKKECAEQGLDIKAVVIRSTEPPKEIREQFSRRELARRQIERDLEQIKVEIGTLVEGEDGTEQREGGRLTQVIQQRMSDRADALGQVRQSVAENIRSAEKYNNIKVTQASKDLSVSKIKLDTAKDLAAARRARGFAEAEVKRMGYAAEAEGVKRKIEAFRDGRSYADYLLIRKLAPSIHEIMSNTSGPFADLFIRFTDVPLKPPADLGEEARSDR